MWFANTLCNSRKKCSVKAGQVYKTFSGTLDSMFFHFQHFQYLKQFSRFIWCLQCDTIRWRSKLKNVNDKHCVKSDQIRRFSGPCSVRIQKNADQKKLGIRTQFTQWNDKNAASKLLCRRLLGKQNLLRDLLVELQMVRNYGQVVSISQALSYIMLGTVPRRKYTLKFKELHLPFAERRESKICLFCFCGKYKCFRQIN